MVGFASSQMLGKKSDNGDHVGVPASVLALPSSLPAQDLFSWNIAMMIFDDNDDNYDDNNDEKYHYNDDDNYDNPSSRRVASFFKIALS